MYNICKKNKHLRFEPSSGEVSQTILEAQDEIASKMQKQAAARTAIADSWTKEHFDEEQPDEEELLHREEKR